MATINNQTLIEIVNRVLRRLREDGTVTTLAAGSYESLIAEFCEEALDEYQMFFNWSFYRGWSEYLYSALSNGSIPGEGLYTFDGVTAFTPDTSTTRATYPLDPETGNPIAYSFPSGVRLRWMPLYVMMAKVRDFNKGNQSSSHEGQPAFFSVRKGHDTLEDSDTIYVYPIPVAATDTSISVYSSIRPKHFRDSGGNFDTNAETPFPSELIVLGAWVRAMEERGEELGPDINKVEQRLAMYLGNLMLSDKTILKEEGQVIRPRSW